MDKKNEVVELKQAQLCGAIKKNGEPCKAYAMRNGRCRKHGGNAPQGIASPSFVHGRYSKYIPTRMAARYEEALHDQELLSLREEIGLLDSRISDVLLRVDTGEAGAAWEQAKSRYGELMASIEKADPMRMKIALNQLGMAINKGENDYLAWNEVIAMIDQRRKLVGDERKRLMDMNQMITVDRAMLVVAAIVDIIRRNVTDHNTLVVISREINAVVDKK